MQWQRHRLGRTNLTGEREAAGRGDLAGDLEPLRAGERLTLRPGEADLDALRETDLQQSG